MMGKDFRFGISGNIVGIDLNKLLVDHPASTYFMRVAADIPSFSLFTEDILIIDRSRKPKKTSLVIVTTDDDPELKIIRFDSMSREFTLWGVAVHIIRNLNT